MSASNQPIYFWNRKEAKKEIETVYGDFAVRWLYQTFAGQQLAEWVLSKAVFSKLYGCYQSSRLSQRKIQPFIKTFGILMEEFDSGPFRTFNDFFIRKFKPGARPFIQEPSQMPAFSEARYYAYEKITPDQKFPVKGTALSAEVLLGDVEKSAPFLGGPLLLARLCPTDYHRFHFPDSGKVLDSYRIHGKLHSVNPVAILYKNEILSTNERHVTILQTENFGKLAYIEVGALCVGKIVQTFLQHPTAFKRGEEKGYFLFGASTVIVLGEAGKWKPDSDLLEQTAQNCETLVRLGERVASRV